MKLLIARSGQRIPGRSMWPIASSILQCSEANSMEHTEGIRSGEGCARATSMVVTKVPRAIPAFAICCCCVGGVVQTVPKGPAKDYF